MNGRPLRARDELAFPLRLSIPEHFLYLKRYQLEPAMGLSVMTVILSLVQPVAYHPIIFKALYFFLLSVHNTDYDRNYI